MNDLEIIDTEAGEMPLDENPGTRSDKAPTPTPDLINLDTVDAEASEMPSNENLAPGTDKLPTPTSNLTNLDMVDTEADNMPSDENLRSGTDKEPTPTPAPRAIEKAVDKHADPLSPLQYNLFHSPVGC